MITYWKLKNNSVTKTKARNEISRSLKRKGLVSDKELQYFVGNYKHTANLGILYLLPQIN